MNARSLHLYKIKCNENSDFPERIFGTPIYPFNRLDNDGHPLLYFMPFWLWE